MNRQITKYVVMDADGPIRGFYNLAEAQKFAAGVGTITEVQETWLADPSPSCEDLSKKLGEAPW